MRLSSGRQQASLAPAALLDHPLRASLCRLTQLVVSQAVSLGLCAFAATRMRAEGILQVLSCATEQW